MLHLPHEIHILVFAGLLLVLSQAAGRVANFFGGPRLIGYLLVGVACGPSLLNLFPAELVDGRLGIITEIALGIIAFSIGGSLSIEKLKHLKGAILWIAILQALAAAVVVFVCVRLVLPWSAPGMADDNGYLAISLVLGAIAAATAPAAILSILHEYHARGSFTTVLLGVVALDDAVTLLFYAFAAATASALLGTGASAGFVGAVADPALDIVIALGIGTAAGFVIREVISYFAPRDLMLGLIVGAIFLTSGLALTWDVSPLLATMMLGFVVTNFVEHERATEAFEVVDAVEEPILGIFFAIAGAHLDLQTAGLSGGLAILLTLARFAGKLIGTRVGARVGGAPEQVRRYLGIALLPAAGVTIGLVLEAGKRFGEYVPELAQLMVSAIVGATLINELITPFAVRFALFKAGEAQSQHKLFPEREKPHSHRHHKKRHAKRRAASGHTFKKK